jgi:hypothetical protein
MHDGFYARISLGFGSLSGTFDDGHPSGEDLEGSSGALGFDVLIGGSPAPGVAIGGALIGEGAASVDFDRGPLRSQDRSLSLGIIGPFIDGFPSPSRGWHLGGMLGLARLSIEDDSLDGIEETLGFGGAFWLGHDFWVADDWSIGPLLRLSGALTRDSGPNVDASSFSVMFMFTGLYH